MSQKMRAMKRCVIIGLLHYRNAIGCIIAVSKGLFLTFEFASHPVSLNWVLSLPRVYQAMFKDISLLSQVGWGCYEDLAGRSQECYQHYTKHRTTPDCRKLPGPNVNCAEMVLPPPLTNYLFESLYSWAAFSYLHDSDLFPFFCEIYPGKNVTSES